MAQGVWVKTAAGHFAPGDPVAKQIADQVKTGQRVVADVRKSRYPKHNAFVHCLLQEIVDNTGSRFLDIDDLKKFLKLRSRMYDVHVLSDGTMALELEKTDFASMDQLAFNTVWKRWAWILRTEVVPDIDIEALRERILEQIA